MLIIHGDNQVQSRQFFLAQKQSAKAKGIELVERNGDQISVSEMGQILGTMTLLGQTPMLVLENVYSRRQSAEKKQLLEYVVDRQTEQILIWENKELTVSQLKGIQASNIKVFPLPKYLFDFLDTLTIESFHKSIETMPVEQVFASLVTRLHKVITGEGRIKKTFSENDLLSKYEQLLYIDYAQKTSSSPFDLTSALELWLVKR